MSTQDWSRVRKGKRFKGDVDANDIPIEPIIAYFGGEVKTGKNVSVKCVLHNDSRNSASINTYDNLYFCFTCGKGGNAVNIVCLLENMEFNDGLKRAVEIATRSGAEIRKGHRSRNSRVPRRTWDI